MTHAVVTMQDFMVISDTCTACECCERSLANVVVIDLQDGMSFLVCALCAQTLQPALLA